MSRVRVSGLSIMAAFLLAAGSHSRLAHSQDRPSEVVILASAAMHGEIAPCG